MGMVSAGHLPVSRGPEPEYILLGRLSRQPAKIPHMVVVPGRETGVDPGGCMRGGTGGPSVPRVSTSLYLRTGQVTYPAIYF